MIPFVLKMSNFSIPGYVLLVSVLVFLWTGCAKIPEPTRSLHAGRTGEVARCADFFALLDDRVGEAEVFDAGLFRVENYPYLRIDRFTASFAGEVDSEISFTAWVDRMQLLDRSARRFEIANLPDTVVTALDPVNGRNGINREVANCGDILQAADFQKAENRMKLRKTIQIPDDYIFLRRVLGIYPLTSFFVSYGVSGWHTDVQKTFSLEPPQSWHTVRYFPVSVMNMAAGSHYLKTGKRDVLGIPVYSREELDYLFQIWAPVWEIQTLGNYDQPGAPIWTHNGSLEVDIGQQPTYTLLSFTRFNDEILTQLNYIIWFPSRPKENALDIYGGFLDGLIYRVTLDKKGEALLYESVHNCGCYYKAYPTDRLRIRLDNGYEEPPLILSAPEIDPVTCFMTVTMESRTHYVQHLYSTPRKSPDGAEMYLFIPYNRLRSLPVQSGLRKSMFGLDSIVPGSRRLERFILWPTGVLSPGAMRQWGRHAVSFVGRRHFDDPDFMDRMFLPSDQK